MYKIILFLSLLFLSVKSDSQSISFNLRSILANRNAFNQIKNKSLLNTKYQIGLNDMKSKSTNYNYDDDSKSIELVDKEYRLVSIINSQNKIHLEVLEEYADLSDDFGTKKQYLFSFKGNIMLDKIYVGGEITLEDDYKSFKLKNDTIAIFSYKKNNKNWINSKYVFDSIANKKVYVTGDFEMNKSKTLCTVIYYIINQNGKFEQVKKTDTIELFNFVNDYKIPNNDINDPMNH